MYRDDARDLDEHDRAVGAILIGETLIAQCERAVARIEDPHAAERWKAMREVHDDYPEIWRQLDRAKKELSSRGANTLGYEELRPHVRTQLARAKDGRAGEVETEIDREALHDARRAIGELKLAVSGADWKAIARRTDQLVDQPQLRRRHRLIAAGLVTAFLGGVVAYFLAITPHKRPDARAEMRKEIAGIAIERKMKIQQTALMLGHRCDPPLAHEYVKLLAMDGRKDDARAFADGYATRCGEDRVVENWANAPRVRR